MTPYQRSILERLARLDLTGTLATMLAQHDELRDAYRATFAGIPVPADEAARLFAAVAAIGEGS